VRGTKWAVDVQPSRTSVFVVRGSVAVRRPSGTDNVVLNAGDGVDADADGSSLKVKQWGAARVSALLARFGQ
jgi:ferric-dicitrate binding protein FerR (iron transport regulator)